MFRAGVDDAFNKSSRCWIRQNKFNQMFQTLFNDTGFAMCCQVTCRIQLRKIILCLYYYGNKINKPNNDSRISIKIRMNIDRWMQSVHWKEFC